MRRPDSHEQHDGGAAGAAEAQERGVEDDLAVGGNLDKIRDILFGTQARDFESRFSRLEERLGAESADIRNEMRGRLDALEAFIRQEFSSVTDRLKAEKTERNLAQQELSAQMRETGRSLADRLKSEQGERSEALRELSSEAAEAGRALQLQIAQLDESTSRVQRELREQLLAQAKAIGDDLRRHHEEGSAALDRAVAALRTEKTDRAGLASLFSEVAMRLNNEFKLPTEK